MRAETLPFDLIIRLVDQVGSALDYAHKRGIVHRDLKPHNVPLDEERNAFLTDFGIIKLLTGNTTLTHMGTVIGTPTYMAPEQWESGQIDGRSDLYSLGVMMFEMLTGQVPFGGDTRRVKNHIRGGEDLGIYWLIHGLRNLSFAAIR